MHQPIHERVWRFDIWHACFPFRPEKTGIPRSLNLEFTDDACHEPPTEPSFNLHCGWFLGFALIFSVSPWIRSEFHPIYYVNSRVFTKLLKRFHQTSVWAVYFPNLQILHLLAYHVFFSFLEWACFCRNHNLYTINKQTVMAHVSHFMRTQSKSLCPWFEEAIVSAK